MCSWFIEVLVHMERPSVGQVESVRLRFITWQLYWLIQLGLRSVYPQTITWTIQ